MNATEAIRSMLLSRAQQGHLAGTARDVGVALDLLESFARGSKSTLHPDVMAALAKDLFNARIGDDNLMRPLNPAPSIPAGITPPRFDPSTRPPPDVNTTGRVWPRQKGAPTTSGKLPVRAGFAPE